MKKLFFAFAVCAVILSLSSCKTADDKIGKISEDFCNCFKKMEANLGSDTKKIISDASNAANPEKSMQDGIGGMDPEKAQKVAEEMASFGEVEDEKSETGRCIKEVEKKYDNAYTLNEKKILEKLIKELEGKPGCSVTASLLKLGLKVKDK